MNVIALKNTKNRILSVFGATLQSAGLVGIVPEPLIPQNDETVFFTSASLTAFKGAIKARKIDDSRIVQPCLRLHALSSLLRMKEIEFYCYFNMVGGLFRPSSEEKVVAALSEIFTHLTDGRVKLKGSTRETPFVGIFERDFSLELDTEEPGFYRWVFGEKGLYGRGVTLTLLSNSGKEFDAGNFIRLYDENDRHIASEIGFGVEVISAAMLNAPDILGGYIYHHLAAEQGITSPHLIESTMSAVAVCGAGVRADSSKRGTIFKKLCRNTAYVVIIEDVNLSAVHNLIDGFATDLNYSEDVPRHVKETIIRQYEQAGKNLQRIANMISTSELDSERLRKRVRNAAEGSAYIPSEIRDQFMRASGLLPPNEGSFLYKEYKGWDISRRPCLKCENI